jgi:hypothetical protein
MILESGVIYMKQSMRRPGGKERRKENRHLEESEQSPR